MKITTIETEPPKQEPLKVISITVQLTRTEADRVASRLVGVREPSFLTDHIAANLWKALDNIEC